MPGKPKFFSKMIFGGVVVPLSESSAFRQHIIQSDGFSDGAKETT
jgi:hypothetical protein